MKVFGKKSVTSSKENTSVVYENFWDMETRRDLCLDDKKHANYWSERDMLLRKKSQKSPLGRFRFKFQVAMRSKTKQGINA